MKERLAKCLNCKYARHVTICDGECNCNCAYDGKCYNYMPKEDYSSNIPSHYSIRGYDPYFVTSLWSEFDPDMTHQEAIFRSNALKYLWRYRHKNGIGDLEKCIDELIKLKEEFRKVQRRD